MRRSNKALAGSTLALALAGGCSGDEGPKKGQIMLALQTDMSIPDDVSHVRIVIFKNGALKFDQKYRVGPQGEEIPATLGVVASDNASDTTEVRVLSYRGANVRTLNRVVTTIPQDRIATLRVPIQWLCDNQVVPSEGIADSYDSSCANPDESCVAGECRKVDVDSTALPDFHIEDITGGAKDATKGVCFDVAPCLDPGRDVVPDAGCTISVPSAELEKVNVGLRLSRGSGGICSAQGGCYIPLDRDDESGWRVTSESGNTTRVALPSAVCKKVASGDAAAVRVSMVCDTKTPMYPTCGPWTSVGKENPDIGPRTDVPAGTGGDSGNGANNAGQSSAAGGTPDVGAGASGNEGGAPPGPSECPDFIESAAVIAPDPQVDRVARLTLEIARRAAHLRMEVARGCVGIEKRVAGTQTMFTGAEPTDEELEMACAAAKAAVPDDEGSWRANIASGHCRADIDAQVDLEGMCPALAGCTFGEIFDRCLTPLTECDGTCSGSCMPGDGVLDVSCEGACLGQCVGTCSAECRGPGGNPLPPTECMGECSGTCSGRCQGQCTSFDTCEGVCRGSCEGNATAHFCEDALQPPVCAASFACPNLAAATAGLHRVCTPPSVFVVGQTPEEVAPAIADNLPRLIHALTEAQGIMRAAGHLQVAWTSLLTAAELSGTNRGCLNASAELLGTALPSLGVAILQAEAVVHDLLGGESPPPTTTCFQSTSDTPCNTCMLTYCCAEMTDCAESSRCSVEIQCVRDCLNQGSTADACTKSCGTDGALDPVTVAIRTCEAESCSGCNGVAAACLTASPGGLSIDDFDDGDTVGPFGSWRVTESTDFIGSLSSIAPGAFDSPHALGVAGRPDPGLSVDFTQCIDARMTSELAFEALIPDLTAPIPVTIRLRTRETETSARGGACVSTRCGDHHLFTMSIPAGSFQPVKIPWGSFLDSFARPPDLTAIVGMDFVVYGSASDQLVLDNLRLGAQQTQTGAQ
jgi:hypothetical protein